MNGSTVRRVTLVTLLAVAALALTGCFAFRRVESTAPRVRTESKTIPRGDTAELDARIRMPIGELTVDGDTTALAEMEFRSTKPSWLPVVESSESQGASGTVTRVDVEVRGDLDGPSIGRNVYEWEIHLASDVPSRLEFELGAGESDIDLGGIDVRQLVVTTGVGETKLDLTGTREHDLQADVTCGIGALTIRVPSEVGVRISGRDEGIGDLSADGFTLSGDELTNAAWGRSDTRIDIALQRGIGDVRIETVD